MDKVIQIFIQDRNGNDINGANVQFFTDGQFVGEANSSRGRASMQIEDADSEVEVRIRYRDITDSAKLSKTEDSYTFKLDLVVARGVWLEYLPALIGLFLILLAVVLTFALQVDTALKKQLILILVALGAGGIASIIPGFLKADVTLGEKLVVAATGAMAVFVIVYFFAPALLDDQPPDAGASPPVDEVTIDRSDG